MTSPDTSPDTIHDVAAERACIGWLLARPDHWHRITDTTTAGDYFDPACRAAYQALTADGYQTVQTIAARNPKYLDAHTLATWAEHARAKLTDRQAAAHAVRVTNLALRRNVRADAAATSLDAADPNIDETELVARVKERADRAEAPDAPPADPAETVDQFMAPGEDDAYDWLIEDLLERRDRMLITATGGVGKSTLLRQFAVTIAAGLHPFTGRPLPGGAHRVLLLDLENSRRQVRRKLRPVLDKAGPFDPRNLHVVAKPNVIDVTTSAGWRWLAGQAAHVRPDVIVGGPVYRFYEGGDNSKDMGGRDKARQVATALDRLRDRHNCALVLEAHPPKGSSTLSPHGSAVWEWWPEFGVGLAPIGDTPDEVRFQHWRYPRDDRHFPDTLTRGAAFGWKANYPDTQR